MKLTLKETVDNFRKQWNWIADETLRKKRKVKKKEYFVAQGIGGNDIPRNYCYMCAISTNCVDCPIDWGGFINTCNHRTSYSEFNGLYARWAITDDYIEAANLAREIVNLPLKEKYREEYKNIANRRVL